ncbi:unnamed protein product, partial [Rotaria magnacalcarata]
MSIEQAGSVSCYLPCGIPPVAICIVCNHHFCWDHFREHRQTYEKYLDDADNKQQPLSNCLATYKNIESKLRSTIDHWESQTIDDIHRSAENARKTLANHIEHCRSHFEEESSTITGSKSINRNTQLMQLEKLHNEYDHSLENIHIVQHCDQRRALDIETTNPVKETFSSEPWQNETQHYDSNMHTTRLGKRLVEKPFTESCVGNYWAIGASDEYLLAQEYENKQLTLFDRHVTRLFQEITRITPYQTNSFRRCTCRNDRLFISYWCQESAVECIQISSWTFQKRWLSPATCRANEFITCIQLNSNDQLGLSIQDENNPFNRQCRFELRDLDLNILRTISLDTISGIFSRMTPLPDGYWALLNVDNNLVFLLDEQCV